VKHPYHGHKQIKETPQPLQYHYVREDFGNFSISRGIPTASPFEKGGLRGIFPKAAPTY